MPPLKNLLASAFILSLLTLIGQDGRFELGARHSALAGTSSTIADGWSIFNNVGSLGNIPSSSFNLSLRNKYDIEALRVMGLAYTHKGKLMNGAVSIYRFGDDIYNQQRISLGLGNRFQFVSLGIGASILQYYLESIGTKRVLILEFGGVAELLPELLISGHIHNINQADLNKEETIPVVMKVGFSYRPLETLMINTELKKDPGIAGSISLGIEYTVLPILILRTGFSPKPQAGTFGLGIHPQHFSLDYAYSVQNQLGNIHELSLAYHLNKK